MKSKYFNFEDSTESFENIKVSNIKGWSGLEVFKFFLTKGTTLTSNVFNNYRPDLYNKEKIFFMTDGETQIESEEFSCDMQKYDAIDLTKEQNYNFKSINHSSIYMISSNNSEKVNSNSTYFNFIKDISKKDLWGGQIISRPYEGSQFTLVLFELKPNFKFDDSGHENEQITWLTEGEMSFYSEKDKQNLKIDMGISIGSNHAHGGISNGAIGFDAFFPKRSEISYKN